MRPKSPLAIALLGLAVLGGAGFIMLPTAGTASGAVAAHADDSPTMAGRAPAALSEPQRSGHSAQSLDPAGNLTSTPTSTATPGPCAPVWTVVASPNVTGTNSLLRRIAPTSATDVWAVGNAGNQTLIEHWNGAQWQIIASPNPGTTASQLGDITALAPNNAWAVGHYNSGGQDQTLILHWDGTSWSVVSSPNAPTGVSVLNSVAAVSATDIWAVGYSGLANAQQTLTEHWNGTQWSIVSSPNQGAGNNPLNSVSTLATDDVWAVGEQDSPVGGPTVTLIEHWNGTQWQVVANTWPATFVGSAARASNDVWAVGFSGSAGAYQTFTAHWDGSQWTQIASPNSGAGDNYLTGITDIATDNAWAVGWRDPPGGSSQVMIQHWDGTAWNLVAGTGAGHLFGITALNAADLWAAGYAGTPGSYTTFIEHYASPCSTPTPTVTSTNVPTNTPTNSPPPTDTPTDTPTNSPTPTSTPTDTPAGTNTPTTTNTPTDTVTSTVTPTRTATPTPSGTATATSTWTATRTQVAVSTPTRVAGATGTRTPSPPPTATPCTISFSDVHPSDYFYTPVLYLACHGVVSGYGDGTFRPYNTTTRGQQVKIVVLGFAIPFYTPPASGQTFADVPPTHPFYTYIETAAHGNIVSGYACGGPGEPCDSQQRPYFRPYAYVTRGQLAKITVVGRGWGLIDPVTPSFADVAPGSAFYEFVETAYCHGIISGYACGGPGEPCNPQQPYFRPFANATRGQIAKIVYGSILSSQPCTVPTVIR